MMHQVIDPSDDVMFNVGTAPLALHASGTAVPVVELEMRVCSPLVLPSVTS